VRLPSVLVSLCLAAGLTAVAPSAAQAIDPSTLLPPVAYPDAVTAIEGHPTTITAAQLLGNDVSFSGATLTFFSVSAPDHGTLTAGYSGGVWSATYTSTPGNTEDDAFTYTLMDSNGHKSAPAVVTVGITPGAAPVAPVANRSVVSGQPFKLDPVELAQYATDADGDVLWVTFLFGAGHGTFTPYTGADKVTYGQYQSDDGFVGTDQIGYWVHDNYGKTTLGVITIKVLAAATDDPPVVPVVDPVVDPVGPTLVSAHGLKAKSVHRGHRGLVAGVFGTHAGTVQVQIKAPGAKAKTFRVTTAATGRFRLVVPSSLAKRTGRYRVAVSYVADASFQGARSYSLSYSVKNGK
jgi:hypothetical protein